MKQEPKTSDLIHRQIGMVSARLKEDNLSGETITHLNRRLRELQQQLKAALHDEGDERSSTSI